MLNRKGGKVRINHVGKTYGAMVVERLHAVKSEHAVRVYTIKWMCCGRTDTRTQKQLNSIAGNMPGQCLSCRREKKPAIDTDQAKGDGARAKSDIVWVDSPWGKVQSLFGWGPESRRPQPWAQE